MEIKPVAYIRNEYMEKFGIPRQSGLVDNISEIIFEKEYRDKNAIEGLAGFSYIWLIWGFSDIPEKDVFSPTVRPPKLGGNKRVGVFSSRSPYRPNRLGLSSVEIVSIETGEKDGPVLKVRGADLKNGTPIYDIKPYLAYTDSHPEATEGFSTGRDMTISGVTDGTGELDLMDEKTKEDIISILMCDPRPGYSQDGEEYGVSYSKYNIRFTVKNGIAVITKIEKTEEI